MYGCYAHFLHTCQHAWTGCHGWGDDGVEPTASSWDSMNDSPHPTCLSLAQSLVTSCCDVLIGVWGGDPSRVRRLPPGKPWLKESPLKASAHLMATWELSTLKRTKLLGADPARCTSQHSTLFSTP